MKVLFVIKTLRFDGGVETSVASLANALISKGESVYIAAFCKHAENHLRHRLNLNEENYIYLGKTHNIFLLPLQVIKILFFLYKYDIDIIHTHLFHAGVVGRLASFFHPVKTVATEHSTFFHWWGRSHYSIDGFLARRTDALIAVSRSVAGTLAARTRVYPNKITVIHNGVDTKFFIPNQNKTISIPRRLVTVAGRFEYAKNIEYALKVLKILVDRNSGVYMNLLGDGSLKTEIVDLVNKYGLKNYVCVLKPIKNFVPIIQTSNLLFMSSHWEGYPMVILEAFAARTLVVGTAVPGIMDIIQNERNGFLLNPDDPDEAAEIILRLLNDSNLQEDLLNNAHNFIKKNSNSNCAQSHISLYKKLITKS